MDEGEPAGSTSRIERNGDSQEINPKQSSGSDGIGINSGTTVHTSPERNRGIRTTLTRTSRGDGIVNREDAENTGETVSGDSKRSNELEIYFE